LSAFLLNDIPWFLTEGKLATIFIKTFSWVFQLAGHFTSSTNANKLSGTIITAPSTSFLAPLPGKSGRPLQGEFFARTSFTLFYYFALLYLFLLASFYIKNPKKLESLVVIISLLLVHHVVP
jgi:hypothetical protein